MKTDPGTLNTNTAAAQRKIAYGLFFNWAKDAVNLTVQTSGTWVDESSRLIDPSGKQAIRDPDDAILMPGKFEPFSCTLTMRNWDDTAGTSRYSPARTDGPLYAYIGTGGLYQTPVRLWLGFYDLGSHATATTLAAGIATVGATSMQVAASAKTGQIAQIDSEYVLIISDGTTVSIARGFGGTTAATHSNGAAVTYVGAMTVEFVGVVKSGPEDPNAFEITLECADRGYIAVQNKASSAIVQETTADTAIGAALDLLPATPTYAPVPSGQRSFDSGLNIFPASFLDDESILQQCQLMAAADGGRFYFTANGLAVYENPQHWIGAASQWTFTTDEMSNVVPQPDFAGIYSDVVVHSSPRSVGPLQEVYRAARRIKVPPGGTYRLEARLSFPCTSVTQAVGGAAPAAGADDTRDFVAVAGNQDITSNVTITTWTAYGQRVIIVFTNANTTYQAEITRLRIRGTPLLGSPQEEIRITNTTTPSDIPKRDTTIGGEQRYNWFIQGEAQARGIGNLIGERVKAVRNSYTIPSARFVPQLECGDLTMLSWSRPFSSDKAAFVIEKSWRMTGVREGKPLLTMSIRAVENSGIYQSANYFKVGTDKLANSKVLFY